MTTPVRRLGIALLVCVATLVPAIKGQQPTDSEPAFVENEVLVTYRNDVPRGRRDVIAAAHRSKVKKRFDELHVDRLELPPGMTVGEAIASLRSRSEIAAAEPNFIRSITSSPDDPSWTDGKLWGLTKIQAPLAWEINTGSPTVVVGVFDTGVNYNHPDLAANMWRNSSEVAGNGVDDDKNGYIDDVHGIDSANNDGDPMDDHGHGTHTAGTIGAVGNNGIGVVGINWKVKVLPCKFIKSDGRGSDSDAIECFNYVVAMKKRLVNVRVTSNSWGSSRGGSTYSQSMKNAIDAAGNVGILNVFAAGNAGANTDVSPFDPASIPAASIVSVAASDSSDNKASFSNYGATSVDLAAPGVSILSTRGSGYSSSSGTSMAAPHVAGAAALLGSYTPTLTPTLVKALLIANVDKLSQWSGKVVSGGRLNLLSSLLAVNDDVLPTVAITAPAASSTFASPASTTVAATATDADGTIAKVDFYANGVHFGTDTSAPYSAPWSTSQSGTYVLSATATDDRGFTGTSAGVSVTVSGSTPDPDPEPTPVPAPAGPVNVALSSNGAKATASSTYSSTYAVSYANDGNRKATTWSKTWADGTSGVFPDWLRVDFGAERTIEEIDVFSGQSNGSVEPTSTLTSANAIRDFQVQYWTGSSWAIVPGGNVTGNQLVWRRFTFSPVVTSSIRVVVTASGNALSRISELEAYQSLGSGTPPPPPPPPSSGGTNVARSSNGGVVTASSTRSGYPTTFANDGNRKATLWTSTWADNTSGVFPDWLRVDFNGSKTIDEINVFSGQGTANDPTLSMTSTNALTNFQVQYWTGSQWAVVPGGSVTGNQNIWRQFKFSALTTTAIRVWVTGNANSITRIAEVEAFQEGSEPDTNTELIGFPADNWWNRDISTAPVDPNSANYIAFINNGSVRRLHPDFGPVRSDGIRIYGMPYLIVDSSVPKKAVTFKYWRESDGVDHATGVSFPFYPIPDAAITQPHMIEGGYPGNVDMRGTMDRHMLIVDKDKRHLYELYNVYYDGTKWLASSGAFFDMNTNDRRTEGWTSADAAGLAILPGLVRYDEAFGAEEITHAFRVTVRATNGYVFPASHRAGSTTGALPMGARLRLKASKNISSHPPELQRIFRAMKRYGLIVADNGTDMFISGAHHPLWNNDILNPAFQALTASDFEVIKLGYQ